MCRTIMTDTECCTGNRGGGVSIAQRALAKVRRPGGRLTGTFEHDFKAVDLVPISYAAGGSWVACYVEARAERRAAGDMAKQGIEPFLPMEKFRGKPGKDPVERPLFPRYVLARVDLDREDWGRLLSIDGVMDVLRNCNTPMRIPDGYVDALRKAAEVGMFDRTTVAPNGFTVGEQVRIAEGPFSGLNAIIQEFVGKIRSATATKRAKVLVQFLGRLTPFELPVVSMEKV